MDLLQQKHVLWPILQRNYSWSLPTNFQVVVPEYKNTHSLDSVDLNQSKMTICQSHSINSKWNVEGHIHELLLRDVPTEDYN